MFNYEQEDEWFAKQHSKNGDYDNPENGCPNCGRFRVMKGDDKKHRCEKCGWCIEDDQYDADFIEYMRQAVEQQYVFR